MKTKFSKILFICCLLQTAGVFTTSLRAQQFRTPYEVPVFSGVCRVTMQNGAIAGGELRGLGLGRGGIKKIVVRDTVTGVKSSFYAQDIASIEFRNTGFNKALNVIAQFESIKKIKNANFGDIRESSATFERMAPYKNKHYVGQLLNPDFASSIKVFYAANARKTNGIGFLTGGMNRAYLIEKDGVAFKVKRGNYKRNFKKLFDDCPELMQTSPGKRTFKHIEEHIYQYDNFKKSINTL